MKSILEALRSPTFKNSGSTARDHLALERTFLAWLRTGLGFIALGIAIERFSALEPVIKKTLHTLANETTPGSARTSTGVSHGASQEEDGKRPNLATAFTLTGAMTIVYGTQRYAVNARVLQSGSYKPAFLGIYGFVGAVVVLGGYSIWHTFVPNHDERTGGPERHS